MTPEEQQISDRDQAMVQEHINRLMEHFDTVQIFTTRLEQATLNGTITTNMGAGNWYARYGQVHQWLATEDEDARAKVRPRKDDAD